MDNKEQGFIPLWDKGPVFCQSEHFKLGTDSVLLADFVNVGSRKNGIDLGCGSGILTILLLEKSKGLFMTGLEINPEAASVAEKNLTENRLDGRGKIICGDIKACRESFRTGEFDLVVANPPYFPEGSGKESPDFGQAVSRGEKLCTLEDVCSAAAYLLKTGGIFCLVHRAERLGDVICTLRAKGLEPKLLRTVSHDITKPPSLILCEARRGGAPGMRILPPLILRSTDGTETAETLRIYHREDLP